MTTLLESAPVAEEIPGRVQWTRAQVEAWKRRGFLNTNRLYELIDGKLYEQTANLGEFSPFIFSPEQVCVLQEAGYLDRDCRYEQIEGDLIPLTSNPPHRFAVIRLRNCLAAVFGLDFLGSQSEITLSPDDPNRKTLIPDASVQKEPNDAYAARLPGPDDLLLVAEVSDSTLAYDLGLKARLYAQAGLAEYWALDLPHRRLIVHREPSATGYRRKTFFQEAERAATLARPDSPILVSDLLPPAEE